MNLSAISPRSHHRLDLLFTILLCAIFYGTAGHDDLLETSNHAWLLLDCIKNGQFLDYYNVVMAHQNSLYYLNNAHYNILCYALYAVWQLPVYLVCQLGQLVVSERFLMFWSKAIGTAAFAGCAVLLRRIATRLGYTGDDAHFIPLYFVLDPIVFFATMVMGQYDSLCLLFLLAAILAWLDGRMLRFSLLAGVAVVFKFFPLLLFVPLLVLVEKRPLRCAGYLLASLWVYIPTAFLLCGRTGDMSVFNGEVIQRIFAAKLAGGLDDLPIYLILYACLLLGCYLYRPQSRQAAAAFMPWLGLAVYGLLFVFVSWHPQWLILLAPFVVLTNFAQRQRAPWLYLNTLLFAGYWMCMNFNFPGQLEENLLYWGMLGNLIKSLTTGEQNLSFYLALIPYMVELAPVVFAAPVLASLLFKFPLRGSSLGDRLAACGGEQPLAVAPSLRIMLFGTFAVCILGIWLGSTLFVLAQAAHLI